MRADDGRNIVAFHGTNGRFLVLGWELFILKPTTPTYDVYYDISLFMINMIKSTLILKLWPLIRVCVYIYINKRRRENFINPHFYVNGYDWSIWHVRTPREVQNSILDIFSLAMWLQYCYCMWPFHVMEGNDKIEVVWFLLFRSL